MLLFMTLKKLQLLQQGKYFVEPNKYHTLNYGYHISSGFFLTSIAKKRPTADERLKEEIWGNYAAIQVSLVT